MEQAEVGRTLSMRRKQELWISASYTVHKLERKGKPERGCRNEWTREKTDSSSNRKEGRSDLKFYPRPSPEVGSRDFPGSLKRGMVFAAWLYLRLRENGRS